MGSGNDMAPVRHQAITWTLPEPMTDYGSMDTGNNFEWNVIGEIFVGQTAGMIALFYSMRHI